MAVPSPVPLARSAWSRRWFRRTTYLIASGAALAGLAGLAGWGLRRPALDRWLLAQADQYTRREYGLGLRADDLEIQPLRGRIRLRRLAVGGDLFRADLLEVDLDWLSLLRTPHLHHLLVQAPVLNLDRARLAAIRVKPRPPGEPASRVRLDHLTIRDGLAQVREPAWNLPRADFHFQVSGTGSRVNQLWMELRVSRIDLAAGPRTFHGALLVDANLTDTRADLEQGRLSLGSNRASFRGGLQFRDLDLHLETEGRLDLVQVQQLAAPREAPAASGQVEFRASAQGRPDRLAWTTTLQGRSLQAKGVPMHPGSLQAALRGEPGTIRLDRLAWTSSDGRLRATGGWSRRAGTTLKVEAEGIPLAPLAGYTRAGVLQDVTARFAGDAHLPSAPWASPRLNQLEVHGHGAFLRSGEPAGGLDLELRDGRFQARNVALNLPDLSFHGEGSGTLGPKGPTALQGSADLATDATAVAGVLKAWDIGMDGPGGGTAALDMSGRTQVQAQVSWNPGSGLQLNGSADIQDPRWHGAQADRLQAEVTIDRDELRVTNIILDKGDGQGTGELWLTWADTRPGQDQIDMRYQAHRLPIREGLKAADVGDLELDGTGSGWVRLHGPFLRIDMDGSAQVEQGRVYGLAIPAASADFHMDIHSGRLQVGDLRVADAPEHLGPPAGAPTGPLALRGTMDMNTDAETWTATLDGEADTAILGLPGPHLQAQVAGRLEGPLTAPLGPIQMPTGSLSVTEARVIHGDQSEAGLEGTVAFAHGRLQATLGMAGMARRVLTLDATQRSKDHLAGTVAVDLAPDTADTALLASRLTGDFLKDARLRFTTQGDWGPGGIAWSGEVDRFFGKFEGFNLVESRPGRFRGDMAGVDLDLALEGRAAPAAPTAPAPPRPAGTTGWFPPRPRTPSATSMTLRGHLPFTGASPLDLTLAGSSNLANLKTIFDRLLQPGQYSLMAEMHPEGSATFDLRLGGPYAATTLDGSLTLKNGRLVEHSFPLSLEDLNFTAQFKGRDVIIPKETPLRATVAQGQMTLWGRASWSLGGISAYDLHTTVEDFQLRDLPTGFEAQGSLDATLKGNDQDGGLLAGDIWIRHALYRTDINLTDLILSTSLGGRSLNALAPSDPLARIDLNLQLHLAEPWELDTNLVKVQGRPRGPFWVRGTLAQPGLKGRMELLPGGRVTNLFPAGDVVLERGMLDFLDPLTFNPNLDLLGRIDISPYLVTLAITGSLDSLQASPSSIPSLRQDEIFAILIDPAAATTVGGAPGSSQTAMTTGLANTGSGLLTSLALANFQEQLRKTLNLDRVSVALRTGLGAPETTVTLGTSFNILGYRTPLVFTHDKAGEVTTISGQVEWRFGDFVLRLGASQSTADSLAPSGEIRHTWSPR